MRELQIPGHYDVARGIDTARLVLLVQGFEVHSEGAALCAHGPGLHSSRQPPLLGARTLELHLREDLLLLRVDLSGARRLQWFVWAFPPGLVLFLALVFTLTGLVPWRDAWWLLLLAGGFLAVFVPVGRQITTRTERAAWAFAQGVADAAKRTSI
jgi:hypothetical protein